MPIDNPQQATMFNDDYPIIGEYRTDDDRIPFYNATADKLYLPGEPVLYMIGTAFYVYMVQGPIRPGKIGYIIRRFTADFPANLSATVKEGTPIYWDASDTTASPAGSAKLDGDVTNGFRIGFASYAYDPRYKHTAPAVQNGKVVCGTTSSTQIRVVSLDGAAVGKGTATTTTTTPAPTTTTAAPTTTTT
jgi:predicted RecA/RadA family phage recombinase